MGVRLIANTSQFKADMASLSRQMRTVKNDFQATSNETDQWGNRLGNHERKITVLNRQMGVHRSTVKQLETAYRDSKRETGENSRETQQLEARLNKARSEMNKTEGQLKRTEAEMEELRKEAEQTGMTFEEFDKSFRDAGTQMQKYGSRIAVASGAMFASFVKVGKDAVGVAMEFETEMSRVEALTGATGEEMQQLEGLAKDMGASTVFSATEAADAMGFLGMAGFDTNQIIDATPALLDLAASAQMDLGRAADITSNIISGFGYEAEDAGRIADVLASASSNANTNVEQMGDAMATVAPIASTLGMDIEDLSSGVMVMSDAGIQGSQSGRQLRQGLIRLSKPTGEAADLIDELGINVFDADGNMKSLDGVVEELQDGLDGMSSQAETAALATLFGSESTAGWSALLEAGSDTLADYTSDLQDSEGAASNMADTMQDNLQGSMTELKSSVEGLQIELGQKLIPYIQDGTEWLTDLTRGIGDMDEATMDAIVNTGLMATGVLGVTTAVAGLVAGVGALMAFAGPIGVALVGGTALVGALGTALFYANEKTKAQEEVSLEAAEALNDQAIELENTADRFDELSGKAEISNRELGRLYDINEELKKANHPDEVRKLQEQYDKLAENSGLSKDELQELFTANDNLIEQTPNIESSITDQGNAWVENTEAVKEYIASMYDASMVEMEAERAKAAEQQKELMEELVELEKERDYHIDRQGRLLEFQELSHDEIIEKMAEIESLQEKTTLGSEEYNRLQDEHQDLNAIRLGQYVERSEKIQDEINGKRDSIELTEEELAKVEALDEGLADILLKRAGITETGHQGIRVLEETLTKNKEKLADLDEEYQKNGELTEEQMEQQNALVMQNDELREAQKYINDELELYGSVNSLVESQRDRLSEGTQEKLESLEATHDIEIAEGNIVDQIQEKNNKLLEEREQLVLNREEQGANKEEIDKQIAAIDEKLNAGDEVLLQMLEELNILELVRDGIQLNGDQLVEHLEQLGYTTEQAYELASDLSDETVEALKEGTEEAGKAGKEKGEAHANDLGFTLGDNKSSAQLLVDGVDEELSKGDDKAQSHGKDKGDGHSDGITSSSPTNSTAARLLIEGVDSELSQGDGNAQSHGKSKGDSHESGLRSTIGRNASTGLLISNRVEARLGATTDGGGGVSAGNQLRSGLLSRSGAVSAAGIAVAASGRDGLASVDTSSTGRNFVSGFRNSINDNNGTIWSRAWSLGRTALSALNSSIRTASPSRETALTGQWFTQGFAGGIEDEAGEATTAATRMATDAHQAMITEIDDLAKSFTGAAYTIRANKEVLKVEHEVNSDGLKGEINDLSNTIDKLTELFGKVLGQQQQQIETSNRDINIMMDSEKVGKGVYDTVDREGATKQEIEMLMNGLRPD